MPQGLVTSLALEHGIAANFFWQPGSFVERSVATAKAGHCESDLIGYVKGR